MKKLMDILFYAFLAFLIVSVVWPIYQTINYVFIGLFLILSTMIIISNPKRIKLDKIDFLLGLLPIAYFIPYLVQNNVLDTSSSFYYILLELAVTIALLILRRNISEKTTNDILITICVVGCISFFISFLYPLLPKKMMMLGIFSYFGDTYVNSVDRFYGTLTYCNSSALLFLVSSFIALFKIHDDEENKNLFRFLLFINFSGFLVTFSKMLSIVFVIVLIALIILKVMMRQKDFLGTIKNSFISMIVPSLLFVRLFRAYLINLNIIYFVFILVFLILLYMSICKILEYLDTKWRFFSYLYFSFVMVIVVFLTVKPIHIPLKINHVHQTNNYIISDFILEENKNYDITFRTMGNTKNISFELCKLYVSDLDPKIEVVKKVKTSPKIHFQFKTQKNFEYYFIRVIHLNSKTDLEIDDLKINGKKYFINSFFVPYQYLHQLDLTKYDKESVTDRFLYYKDAWKVIKNNKSIIGEGFQTFRYYASKGKFEHETRDPHSYLFQLWLDVGIYGLIYVISLVVIGIICLFQYRYQEDKHIWFCIFCSCMIVLPFDAVYSTIFMKILLMLSFIMLNEKREKLRD